MEIGWCNNHTFGSHWSSRVHLLLVPQSLAPPLPLLQISFSPPYLHCYRPQWWYVTVTLQHNVVPHRVECIIQCTYDINKSYAHFMKCRPCTSIRWESRISNDVWNSSSCNGPHWNSIPGFALRILAYFQFRQFIGSLQLWVHSKLAVFRFPSSQIHDLYAIVSFFFQRLHRKFDYTESNYIVTICRCS